ncbi:MAG: N-acetyltransferase [Actinobacteria bacterium]|nr:N-acetyltransferase [Actinomycetota bacterium]
MSTPGPDHPRVRVATPADAPAITEVVTTAFGPEGPLVARLIEALQASPAWDPALSFVAETVPGPGETGSPPADARAHPAASQVIGYLLATVNLLDAPRRLVNVLLLSPLAVHPAHQNRGVGSGLVRHALTVMQDRPEPLVFLEGHPSYYPRFGFRPAVPLGFRRPSLRIPEPAFMVHPLPAYQPWMTGTLVLADPFWRLDCVGLREPEPQ